MGFVKYKEAAQNAIYHVYNRGNQKQRVFHGESDYEFYLKKLSAVLRNLDFSLIAYCLMPNHVHLLLKQRGKISPSKLIASLHTSYVMMVNNTYQLTGHLFQGRFRQKIVQDDVYLQTLIQYIHFNPVKDGLVLQPNQYAWSSFRELTNINSKIALCDKNFYKENNLSLNLGLSYRTVLEIEKGKDFVGN